MENVGRGNGFETSCAVWSIRFLSLLSFLSGLTLSQEYAVSNGPNCVIFPGVSSFWSLVQVFSGFWIAFDVACCAFCLSGTWLQPLVGFVGRVLGICFMVIALYGLSQYMSMPEGSSCAGIEGLIAACVLSLYVLMFALWVLLFESNILACRKSTRLLSTWARCAALLSLNPWPPAQLPMPYLDMPRPPYVSQVEGPGRPVCSPLASSPSTPGPSPEVFGKTRSSHGEIRAVRGGEVLYVGRSRKDVKQWLYYNLQDANDVELEEGPGMSWPSTPLVPPGGGRKSPPRPMCVPPLNLAGISSV